MLQSKVILVYLLRLRSNEMKKTRWIPPNKRKKLKEIKKLSAIAE
jgi:hypothetical protein